MKRIRFIAPSFILITLFFVSSFSQNREDFHDNKIISIGDSWYYYDSIMPNNFRWFEKIDSHINWKLGRSIFGYGNDDEVTVIGYGPDEENKLIAAYFIKAFELHSPSDFIGYSIKMIVDDGAVVYLNGTELWRLNMPVNAITPNTYADFRISGEKEDEIQTFVIEPHLLANGTNIIAVSVHQVSANSSDSRFWLELFRIESIEMIHKILKSENVKLDKELADLRNQMLVRASDLEIQIKDQELQLNRLYINITIGIVSLFLLGSFFFWLSQRQRNRAIAENNVLLHEELTSKNKELINLSLEKLNKNRLILDLENGLNNLEENKDSSQLFTQLKSKLSGYSIQDKEWGNLQLHLENVYSGYFKRLRSEFPTLTSSELRMCGYMRLQLTTKEIANMLNVEAKSVQTSRYRLKKKFDVPGETNLIQFLSKYY